MNRRLDDERLADWVDDRLDAAARARLEAELAADPELRALADEYRRTVEAVRGALRRAERPRPGFADRVMARVAEAREPAPDVEPQASARPARILPWLGSVAAAAALVAAFLWVRGFADVTMPAELRTANGAVPPRSAAGGSAGLSGDDARRDADGVFAVDREPEQIDRPPGAAVAESGRSLTGDVRGGGGGGPPAPTAAPPAFDAAGAVAKRWAGPPALQDLSQEPQRADVKDIPPGGEPLDVERSRQLAGRVREEAAPTPDAQALVYLIELPATPAAEERLDREVDAGRARVGGDGSRAGAVGRSAPSEVSAAVPDLSLGIAARRLAETPLAGFVTSSSNVLPPTLQPVDVGAVLATVAPPSTRAGSGAVAGAPAAVELFALQSDDIAFRVVGDPSQQEGYLRGLLSAAVVAGGQVDLHRAPQAVFSKDPAKVAPNDSFFADARRKVAPPDVYVVIRRRAPEQKR